MIVDKTPLSSLRPVFIHAMWRTGSTYIWNKYRMTEGWFCYYEPFHEQLISIKREQHWTSQKSIRRRHPPLTRPYFEEYDISPHGGVPGFDKSFSYETYSLEDEERQSRLQSYIDALLLSAGQRGLRPLLKLNRSLLRCGWLNAAYKPFNILLVRRPSDIWQSFLAQPSLYYVTAICTIIGQNRSNATLDAIAAQFNVPTIRLPTVQQEFYLYERFVRSQQPETLYEIFLQFYMFTTVVSLSYADCVIDLAAVSNDRVVRSTVANSLASLGIPISLDDCVMPARKLDIATAALIKNIERRQQDKLRKAMLGNSKLHGSLVKRHQQTMASDIYQSLELML